MSEFSHAWDTQQKNGLVTRQEFFDYHTEVGAHLHLDEEFEAFVNQVWQ